MSANKFFLGLGLLFASQVLNAGTVRSVETNGESMSPIRLRMGKSTVLRFQDKPQKVVLGNSNYYSVEFIAKDVALQPQGQVDTNLFVYGQKHVYGFLLSTRNSGRYDDLVQVTWKKKKRAKEISAKKVVKVARFERASKPDLRINLDDQMEALITDVYRLKDEDFYILDLYVQNTSDQKIDLKEVELVASRRGKPLNSQDFVFKKTELGTEEASPARVFLKLSPKKAFSLYMRLKEKEKRAILWRKFL